MWRKQAARDVGDPGSSRSPSLVRNESGHETSSFEEKAEEPVFPVLVGPELKIRETRPVAGASARGSKEKEATLMRSFDERCLVLYNELLSLDQEMEITQMLSLEFRRVNGEPSLLISPGQSELPPV